MVRFPIGLAGIVNATYSADVLGGSSSRCPGLVPLHTLMQQKCILFCSYFSNGDGLLGVRVIDSYGHEQYRMQRLLHTDSGHYLLPIDNFQKKSNYLWDKQSSKVAQSFKKKATDQGYPHQEKSTVELLSSTQHADVEVSQVFQ
jgi:hypothetical protein